MKKRAVFALLATYLVASALHRISFVVGVLVGFAAGVLWAAWTF